MERDKEGSRNTDSELPELEPSEGSGRFAGTSRIIECPHIIGLCGGFGWVGI